MFHCLLSFDQDAVVGRSSLADASFLEFCVRFYSSGLLPRRASLWIGETLFPPCFEKVQRGRVARGFRLPGIMRCGVFALFYFPEDKLLERL